MYLIRVGLSCTLYHRKYIWAKYKYKVQRSLKWIFLSTARKYSGLSCLIFLFHAFLKREVKWRSFKFNWKGKEEVLPLAGPLLEPRKYFACFLYVQKCSNCNDANPIRLCDSTLFVCLKREKVNWKFLFGKTWELCSVNSGAFVGHQQVQQATQIHPTDSTPITKANTSSLFYGYYVHDVIFYTTCNLDK